MLWYWFGPPEFFITFTCNGDWHKLKENFREIESPSDRSNLMTRVFDGKLKALLKDLTEKNILGKVIASTYVIESQKRGYPHAHILLWLHKNVKIRNLADVNQLVCAKIPDPNKYPKLYHMIKNHMIMDHVALKIQNQQKKLSYRALFKYELCNIWISTLS